MISERRKFKRFEVTLDIAFRTSQGPDEYFTGITKNFSRKGLCFEAQTFGPALKAPMKLEVKLPEQDSFIPISGNVAWKEKFKNRCLIGVEFTEINNEAKSQILDYAYDQWVEKNRGLKSAAQG